MDELEVTLGQRAVASVHGDQTTATAYAGLGARHVLLVADGAAGPVATRLAAQVATSAALARFRASVFPHTEEQLVEAFAEAHQAVRRGAMGTHADGNAGASMVAVVVEARGVVAARVGGGRVYVIDDGLVRPLFRDEGQGYIGDGERIPDIVTHDEPLTRGGRVVVMNESVARAVAADVDRLASGPAQLAAGRLVDAARRRAQYDPLAVQVMEVHHAPPRPGHHPAFSRLDRDSGRTLSADGRWIGPSDAVRARSQRGRGRSEIGWVIWFGLAVLIGAGAALVVAEPTAPEPDPMRVERRVEPSPTARVVEPDARVAADAAPAEPDVAAPAGLPTEIAADIDAAFAHDSPTRAARALRSYITRRFAADGDQVFSDLEAWLESHDDPAIIATLLELMKERELKRTHRWLTDLLPRLYSRGGGDEP